MGLRRLGTVSVGGNVRDTIIDGISVLFTRIIPGSFSVNF